MRERRECYPGLDHTELIRLSVAGEARSVADVPRDVGLPGVMLARRPGETRYVRYGRDGDLVTARFEEGAPYEPLFRLRPDGGLEPVTDRPESPK